MSGEAPPWLPAKLDLPESRSDRIAMLVNVFRKDILRTPLIYESQPVHLNMRLASEGLPECFWHLCGQGENRQIDPERAVRLRWLRAVIENADDAAVLKWDGPGTAQRQTCRYLWLRDFDYCIVLAPGRQGEWNLVTAHAIEGNRRRRDLMNRYIRAGVHN